MAGEPIDAAARKGLVVVMSAFVRITFRVLWALVIEPLLFLAGYVLGLAFGLTVLCFETLGGLIRLSLTQMFTYGPLVALLYYLYYLSQQTQQR